MKDEYLKKMERMSKQEKIDYLETCMFYLDMKDHWEKSDYERFDILCELLKEVR